jgi:MoaA/NifB/PqqE/SkfB family radical SAM enzyme
VAPLAEQVAFHLMGDPLVHPHLSELLDISHEEGARIFFVTNGVLLREKQTELLLHPAIRQVCFSLHSFFDNFPDRDPGPYLEKIFEYTERAFRERPDLYINYRLWNLADPRGTGAKNEEMLARVKARFGAEANPSRDARIQKSQRLVNRLYLHFDTEFVWPSLAHAERGERGTCHGLSTHFGIHVDGTVVPCCLDKEAAMPLGNALLTPLTEILDGPRAETIRVGFSKGQLVEDLCKRCLYIERFDRAAARKLAGSSISV